MPPTSPDTDAQVDPHVLRVDLGVGGSAVFTTRRGGRSGPPYDEANLGLGVADDRAAVLANRDGVARVLGVPVTWARPVHGSDVAVVAPDGGVAPGAPTLEGHLCVDALVTTAPGRGLAALAADCVPVLLVARSATRLVDDAGEGDDLPLAVAAVHSGRRGLVAGVVPAAVAELRRAASVAQPETEVTVEAVIGPAICGRCYEVPAALRSEVAAVVPESGATTSWGTAGLDLPAGVAAQLRAAGARTRHTGLCTREDGRWFSHRRDGVTGRFAGVIAMLDRDTPHRLPDAVRTGG